MPNFNVKVRFKGVGNDTTEQVWQVMGVKGVKEARAQVVAAVEPFAVQTPQVGGEFTGDGIQVLYTMEIPRVVCLSSETGRTKLKPFKKREGA